MRKTKEAAPAVRQHCQGPEVTGVTIQSLSEVKDAVEVKPLTKIMRILDHFARGGSLNRFEAERIGDHCLNSTVSDLIQRHDLTFIKQRERVPTRFGMDTQVVRYSLSPREQARARALLEFLFCRSVGGAA